MKKILVDAGAFVALVRVKDKNHSRAKKIYRRLKKENFRFLVSNTSLYETATIISQRISHRQARNFLVKAVQGLDIIFITPKRDKKAKIIFNQQTSKNVSFFDCLNMAVLKEFGLKEIFSFDKNYKKNGFLRVGFGR